MSKIYFKVENNAVIKYTPVPGIENACQAEAVMTKEIFQECYKKWIETEMLSPDLQFGNQDTLKSAT